MRLPQNESSKVVTTRGDFNPDQIVLAAGSWSPVIAQDLGLRLPIQPAKGLQHHRQTDPQLFGNTPVPGGS